MINRVEASTGRRPGSSTAASNDPHEKRTTQPKKSAHTIHHKWVRRLHGWLSMTSLLIVLFFALTGITLNHPTWFGAGTPQTQTASGTLPGSSLPGGTADPLTISEYLRSTSAV